MVAEGTLVMCCGDIATAHHQRPVQDTNPRDTWLSTVSRYAARWAQMR